MKEVAFPDGLEYIGNYAFYQTPLEGVIFPASLKYIGDYNFYFSQLEDVSLPENPEYIGLDAYLSTKSENSPYESSFDDSDWDWKYD